MTEIINGIPQPVDTSEIYVKATHFEIISAGATSGTVTKPAGSSSEVAFILDEWGTDTDALVSTMANGKPTFKSPVDSGGNTITTTFNTSGEFAFSGTPVPSGDHAVVFVYKCYLKNFDVDESLFESELVPEVAAHAASHTDGTDDIQNATASQKGLATAAQTTKLDGVEAGAAADQTGAEIKALYEAEADTNAYDDAAASKLAGIESEATKYPDTGEQAFLDADHTKLDGIEEGATVGGITDADAIKWAIVFGG